MSMFVSKRRVEYYKLTQRVVFVFVVLPYKATKLFPTSSYLSNPRPPIHLTV